MPSHVPDPQARDDNRLNGKRINDRRICDALLIGVLIAALLWKTQWPAIRPGLIVLLAGQVTLAGFLFFRGRRNEGNVERQAAWIENCARWPGFLLLAFGFWRSTGNVLLAVGLGIVYPAVIYWGIDRVSKRQAPQCKPRGNGQIS